MAILKYLFWHCSATPPGRDLRGADIIRMHTDTKPQGRGWKVPGYADIILLDGLVENIHEYDHDQWISSGEITNGARGYNGEARHVCYIGGVNYDLEAQDTRTSQQIETMIHYNHMMIRRYPDIEIGGHNQVAAKDCPSFNVTQFLLTQGIPKKNIFNFYKS